MWVALWTVLVMGAIVVPALLILGLWRRVKALGREFAAATDELTLDLPFENQPAGTHPTLFEPGTAARARLARRSNRQSRAERRAASLRGARRRWTTLGLG